MINPIGSNMEDIVIATRHVYPKPKKHNKQLVKERRAKVNKTPSRRIRHALTPRWSRVVEYDDSVYWCLPWSYSYDNDFCGTCERCTRHPAKLVDTKFEELVFEETFTQ